MPVSFSRSLVLRMALAVALLASALVLAAVPPQPAAAASECGIAPPSATFEGRVSGSAAHAQVWRLYQAVFLRQPDEIGMAYWMDRRYAGVNLSDIAFYFSGGQEFRNAYGDVNDVDFVRLVYRNVMCREPDADGQAYWVGRLRAGLSRQQMMINFTEGREYLRFTKTCFSVYDSETAEVDACAVPSLTPIGNATLTADGYRRFSALGGRVKGVEIDLTRNVLRTGSDRCSIASINGNWMPGSEKDGPNPSVLGIGVVGGVHARGSSDRTDRGVVGWRAETEPASVVEVWPGDTLSDDDVRLNSVMYSTGTMVLEQWHASAETSPYLKEVVPGERVRPGEWVWAAAGIPLLIDGQPDQNFSQDYYGDPYTYQTVRHTFLAVDQNTRRAYIGGTSSVDVRDLLNWATSSGFEDLIKFDGGASAEYNEAGRAVVAGTSRDVPVWLGVGCR